MENLWNGLELFLLNIVSSIQSKYLVVHIISAAKLIHAQMCWNSRVKEFDRYMYDIAEMDTLTERLREGNQCKIESYWKTFNDWIDIQFEVLLKH